MGFGESKLQDLDDELTPPKEFTTCEPCRKGEHFDCYKESATHICMCLCLEIMEELNESAS